MSELPALIREAERVKKRGAGITEYEKLYNAMLRKLKELSSKLEIYEEAQGDE